jgi:hypothetical protein
MAGSSARLSTWVVGSLAGSMLACSSTGSDGGSSTGASGNACGSGDVAKKPICSAWRLNQTATAARLKNGDGSPLLVDVQEATLVVVDGASYVAVKATGVPSYRHTVTKAEYDALTTRPKAASDFVKGAPTIKAGDVVDFATDIGFNSNAQCSKLGGFGWWPPGPTCPTDQQRSASFPLEPSPATATCYTRLGPNGLVVNGVSIYNWADGHSFKNQGVWHNLAQKLEIYDLDLCLGHAIPGGDYHQHLDSPCIAEMLSDDGKAHSPVYGFGSDGYPLRGPWHASGVRAESCWKTRDYDNIASITGCGTVGARTCVLNDRTKPASGTKTVTAGPSTSEKVGSLSGNTFTAVSGLYFEDYYFDAACAAQAGRYLDEHNGHDHDGLGYHYHVTESFPYNIGPSFYGKLPAKGLTACSADPVQKGPP